MPPAVRSRDPPATIGGSVWGQAFVMVLFCTTCRGSERADHRSPGQDVCPCDTSNWGLGDSLLALKPLPVSSPFSSCQSPWLPEARPATG